jgi:hypothetical protein
MTDEKRERVTVEVTMEPIHLEPDRGSERPTVIWDIPLDGAQYSDPVFLIPLTPQRKEPPQ